MQISEVKVQLPKYFLRSSCYFSFYKKQITYLLTRCAVPMLQVSMVIM